ncbi:hypothetical protein ACQP0C_00820 [Nocardia sp. CA-129566]|uniref:hypothetical protein n=1 Tax=Nocardia sp. CA-129566 TaxID=3239976 RepID=UPI003D99399E
MNIDVAIEGSGEGMASAQPEWGSSDPSARTLRLAILCPDAVFLDLIDVDSSKEKSYSQSCCDWPESKPHLAIIVAPHNQPGTNSGERIWGLGIVRPAHKTDMDRKVLVSHGRQFREHVAIPGDWFSAGSSDRLPKSGPVTQNVSAVLADLRGLSPYVATEVEKLTPLLDDEADWGERELRWRDERDALLLFAKIAGVAPKDFVQVQHWNRALAGASFISGLPDAAAQLELDDPHGRIVGRLDTAGETVVRRFVDPTRQRKNYDLQVTSVVARREITSENGSIDAYYYHAATETLVMFRYVGPGLDVLSSPSVRRSLAALHARSRGRMRRIRRRPNDFGLLEDPIFVRVHADVPFTSVLPRTIPGAIYPVDQVEAAISVWGNRSSPRPFAVFCRHLVPTDFVRLARDGWFGAREVPLDAVLDLAEMSADDLGCALLVVDFSTRPRGNGS